MTAEGPFERAEDLLTGPIASVINNHYGKMRHGGMQLTDQLKQSLVGIVGGNHHNDLHMRIHLKCRPAIICIVSALYTSPCT